MTNGALAMANGALALRSPPTDEQAGEETEAAARLADALAALDDVRLRAAFDSIDKNDDGGLTRAEVIRALRAPATAELLGFPARITDDGRAAFEAVFQGMDRDNSRSVGFDEFAVFVRPHLGHDAVQQLTTLQEQEQHPVPLELEDGVAGDAAPADAAAHAHGRGGEPIAAAEAEAEVALPRKGVRRRPRPFPEHDDEVATQTQQGAVGPAWTRGKTEAPRGREDMGTWIAAVYTPEQQARLAIDKRGAPCARALDAAVATPGAGGYTPEQQHALHAALDSARALLRRTEDERVAMWATNGGAAFVTEVRECVRRLLKKLDIATPAHLEAVRDPPSEMGPAPPPPLSDSDSEEEERDRLAGHMPQTASGGRSGSRDEVAACASLDFKDMRVLRSSSRSIASPRHGAADGAAPEMKSTKRQKRKLQALQTDTHFKRVVNELSRGAACRDHVSTDHVLYIPLPPPGEGESPSLSLSLSFSPSPQTTRASCY